MTTAVGRLPAPPVRTAAAVRQLARVEGARLVRHPILLAGALLSIAFAVTFVGVNEFGGDYFVLVGPGTLPLAFAALIAVNLAALRSERSDTGELYGSLAAPARVRTLAHVASVGWAAGAGALLVGAGVLVYGAWDGLQVTPAGATVAPSAAELAQGPVAVATLGSLGVALARWSPYLPVAPVVGVGALVAEIPFSLWNIQAGYVWYAPVVNPARTLGDSSWPCAADQTWPCLLDRFASEAVGWHLLYLAGLAVAFAALALLHDDRRPRTAVVLAVGIGLAVGAGILQVP